MQFSVELKVLFGRFHLVAYVGERVVDYVWADGLGSVGEDEVVFCAGKGCEEMHWESEMSVHTIEKCK